MSKYQGKYTSNIEDLLLKLLNEQAETNRLLRVSLLPIVEDDQA